MADFDSVCTALTAALVAGGYDRSFDYVPDSITGYALVVAPASGEFLTFDTSYDSDDYELTITVLVPKGTARTGQAELKGYLARTGVRAAVMADPTLGGEVDHVEVSGWSNFGLTTIGLVEHYSAEMAVTARVSV